MQTLVGAVRALREIGRRLGPYLMLELLMPGGTLLAIALFLYRRRQKAVTATA